MLKILICISFFFSVTAYAIICSQDDFSALVEKSEGIKTMVFDQIEERDAKIKSKSKFDITYHYEYKDSVSYYAVFQRNSIVKKLYLETLAISHYATTDKINDLRPLSLKCTQNLKMWGVLERSCKLKEDVLDSFAEVMQTIYGNQESVATLCNKILQLIDFYDQEKGKIEKEIDYIKHLQKCEEDAKSK